MMHNGTYKNGKVHNGVMGCIVAFIFLITMSVTGAFAMDHTSKKGSDHSQMEMPNGKKSPSVEHPMMKPKMFSSIKRCPNCGMMINMWARTRHFFKHPEGEFTTCSIRCMADKAANSGAQPTAGKVALYLDPDTMVSIKEASYVIGSSAKGTMTMKSKIAFADKQAAEKFVAEYGGKVVDFNNAFNAATMELPKSRMMIDNKRKTTGKIKEPTDKDTCVVCGMYPARYPKHNAQVWVNSGETLHFCSTRCFVNYNDDPNNYVKKPVKIKMKWVTLFSDGMYESAYGPYYVVGSKVHGPMGMEALPFKARKDAQAFVEGNGGKIVSFPQLTPAMVNGGHHQVN